MYYYVYTTFVLVEGYQTRPWWITRRFSVHRRTGQLLLEHHVTRDVATRDVAMTREPLKIPWLIDCEKGDLILPGLLGIMMGPIGLGNLSTN